MGRDSCGHEETIVLYDFNPRARVGRDKRAGRLVEARINFNPRARVGRDVDGFVHLGLNRISIHAPAWGATRRLWLKPAILQFQSTRPRGARHASCVQDSTYTPFQSTRPRGARRNLREDLAYYCGISIHAPAWGATAGCGSAAQDKQHFNPRARVGRDETLLSRAESQGISIHAPAWGATLRRRYAQQQAAISIHAPAWGATEREGRTREMKRISIHAPAWGATK